MTSPLQLAAPWKYPMGIELTFVPAKYSKAMEENSFHKKWDYYTVEYRNAAHAAGLQEYKGQSIYQDHGCVEHPSPILRSWQEAQDFYCKASEVANSVGLVCRHPRQETGMGHIHFSKVGKVQRKRLYMDLIARPYLPWIFATPNGTLHCRSLLFSKNSCVGIIRTTNYEGSFGRAYCLAERGKTLEWRAFDSAEDWDEQEGNIAFLQKYVATVTKAKHVLPVSYTKQPIVTIDLNVIDGGVGAIMQKINEARQGCDTALINQLGMVNDLYSRNIDMCIAHFNHLIVDTLGLPWEPYEWRIDRNLRPAFEWGERL